MLGYRLYYDLRRGWRPSAWGADNPHYPGKFTVQPDFAYTGIPALIFIDGPHHEADPQRRLDEAVTERLEDAGYTVIRFPVEQSAWGALFAEYAFVFL